MTAQPIQTIEEPAIIHGTEAWHRARHATLGASERAAAMGLSRWETRSELAERKIAPFVMPEEPTGALRRGIVLERPALFAWNKIHFYHWYQNAEYQTDAVYSWMSATPDFFVWQHGEESRLLEIKTALLWKRHEFGEAGSADIPVEYLLQVQQQMAVTGVHSVELFVVFAEQQAFNLLVSMHDQGATDEQIAIHIENTLDCASYFVEFDQDLEDRCLPILEEFWNDYVKLGAIPPNIKTMQHLDGMVKAGEAEQVLAREYYLNWLSYKSHENRLEVLREKMELAIGEKEGIDTDSGRFTWRKCKDTVREVTDWEAMARHLWEDRDHHPSAKFETFIGFWTETKTIRQGTRKFLVPTRRWEKDL